MIEQHTLARAQALALEPRLRGPHLPEPPSLWTRLRPRVMRALRLRRATTTTPKGACC